MSQAKIILIAGPTASGKSALAIECAEKTRGTIINADAMQIYEGLPLLTAQPSPSEHNLFPHALYGVVPAHERSSVGAWLTRAIDAIAVAQRDERTPILTGGTGLYFKAFLQGLASIPPIPTEVRKEAAHSYDTLGEEKFRAALKKLDAASALKLAKNDRQRLIRAYEVVVHTGLPLAAWQKKTQKEMAPDHYEAHLLMPEREALYHRCDQRFLSMIERGAVDEVARFLGRRLDPTLPAMKTIGVRELAAYIHKEISLKDAILAAQQSTRNYAKRQLTWFRNQWPFPRDP